jgi:hypothetical protein
MNAQDTVIGTAKQIVAEIVGDGRPAEAGARQTSGSGSLAASDADVDRALREKPSESPDAPFSPALPLTNEDRLASLLGHAALKVWSDLPRDAQERLFDAAVDDGIIADSLAVYLHDHHPKTAHPLKPTQIA